MTVPFVSARWSQHILSHHQQDVSDNTPILPGRLMTSHPMTNSMWATMPQAVISCLIPWLTWQGVSDGAIFQLDHIWSCNEQTVSGSALSCSPTVSSYLNSPIACELQCPLFYHGLITSNPVANRKWVTMFCPARSSHLINSMTDSEWGSTFFTRKSHISSHGQQLVSCSTLFSVWQSHHRSLSWLPAC